MAFTEEQLQEMLKNPGVRVIRDSSVEKPPINARGREERNHRVISTEPVVAVESFPKMNKLEASYGQFLELQKFQKKIVDWRFEPFNLRLVNPKCFYRIDFMVINNLNQIELHETKGKWVDGDALVKFKVAATLFPFFIFKWVTKEKSEFIVKTLRDGAWKY